MDHSESSRRAVAHSQFRDHATILQGNVYGDVHYHPSLHQPMGHLSAQPPAQPLTQVPVQAAVCVIPYPRNENVVHRPNLVDRLNALLPQTERHCSAALWGLGGSGKTQIALDYAYRRSDDDTCSVFWVHADSEATFVHDYQIIAQELGINRSLPTEALLDAVCRGIKAQPKWVLIIDNADDLRLFGVGQTADQTPGQATNLYKYVPRGTVLWTSRDERIVGSLVGPRQGIPVARMTSTEAQNLLQMTRNTQTSNEEVETATLLEELQWLPLAVSQAGAYMRRTRASVKEYLALLAQSRHNVLRVTESDRHRRPSVANSVLDTWSISIQRLQNQNKMAYRILHVIAYLDNQNIGHEILAAASRYNDDGVIEQPSQLAVTEAITRLRELSFIGVCVMHDGSEIYEMHKLVQEATRYGLSLRKSIEVAEGSNAGTRNLANSGEALFAGIALQVMLHLFPLPNPQTRAHCEKYLAHAIQVGEWAEVSSKQVDTTLLLDRVSVFLHYRGRWREKMLIDTRALNILQRALGEMHPTTLGFQVNLASAYYFQGRYIEAEPMFTLALRGQQRALGQRHPSVIRTMTQLADTQCQLHRYDEAEGLYVEASRISRQLLGERDSITFHALLGCASVYRTYGRYHEAESIYVKIWNLSQEEYGERHPSTLEIMQNLALTYHYQTRHREAEAILVRVLNLFQEVYGETHAVTCQTMYLLAETRYCLGYRQEALSLVQQCLHLQHSSLGPNHPHTIRSAESVNRWTPLHLGNHALAPGQVTSL